MNRIFPEDDEGHRLPRPYFAVLDEQHNVIFTSDIHEFCQFFKQTEKRIVANTQITGLLVSTVFLGINHGFLSGQRPLWFETMVFADYDRAMPPEIEVLLTKWREGQQQRYSTWREAEEGHNQMLQIIQEGLF
jgi:hypothetical protein